MSEPAPPAGDTPAADATPDQTPPAAQPPAADTAATAASTPPADDESRGLARDFAGYAELEHERRRNSFDDFDAELFAEAVQMVKKKLRA